MDNGHILNCLWPTKSPAPAPAAPWSHAAPAAPAADGARPRRGPPSCAGRPGDPRCLGGGAPGDHLEKDGKTMEKMVHENPPIYLYIYILSLYHYIRLYQVLFDIFAQVVKLNNEEQ